MDGSPSWRVLVQGRGVFEFYCSSLRNTATNSGRSRSRTPDADDLEVCVMDYDGIVHALAFRCHRHKTGWVDASTKKRIDIQPTHWRKSTDS
jgi:hypothetical protein